MLKEMVDKKVISYIFSKLPHRIAVTLTESRVIIPYYHMINDGPVSHIKYLYAHKGVRQFVEDLDFLLRHYKPISLFDLLGCFNSRSSLPKRAFLLTFDDGFREMHDIVAPILLDKGIPATFFVNSSFVDNNDLCYEHKASILADKVEGLNFINVKKEIEKILSSNNISDVSNLKKGLLSVSYNQRKVLDEIASIMNTDFNEYLSLNKPYLTSSQIRGLIKSGFSIGAHSIDHPHYSALTLDEQLVQTLECVKFVMQNFQLDYGAFAFPYQDDSVSIEYFSKLYDSGLVDISFGTGGMKKDIISRNLQRINFETPLMPANRILALEHARKIYKTIIGTNKITRPQTCNAVHRLDRLNMSG